MNKKVRDSNIELLRCLLMLLIVIQHFVAHNILSKDDPVDYGGKNFISANMLLAFCVSAVNCFVLISGYYGIKFSLKKLFLFLLPIFFYELVMSFIWYPCKHHVSITAFNYWFVRSFVALMIISPILNKGLECLNRRQIQVILLLLIAIFIVPLSSFSGNAGKNILIFVLLYLTGYYLRHFYKNKLSGGGILLDTFYAHCLFLRRHLCLHVLGTAMKYRLLLLITTMSLCMQQAYSCSFHSGSIILNQVLLIG